jgi:hypothetical protein
MQRLQAFVHISSAYVNINQPQQDKIHEQLYPLVWRGKQVHHTELADGLLGAGSAQKAQRLAKQWCRRCVGYGR